MGIDKIGIGQSGIGEMSTTAFEGIRLSINLCIYIKITM